MVTLRALLRVEHTLRARTNPLGTGGGPESCARGGFHVAYPFDATSPVEVELPTS